MNRTHNDLAVVSSGMGRRASRQLQRQQASLLVHSGEARSRAIFTQGAMNDIASLCTLADNLKQVAPGGSQYYDHLIAMHVLATSEQIARWGDD